MVGCLCRRINTGLRAGAGFEVLERHIHTFVVEPPGGPVSRGECECGFVREDFSNYRDSVLGWRTGRNNFWLLKARRVRSMGEVDRVEDWANPYGPEEGE